MQKSPDDAPSEQYFRWITLICTLALKPWFKSHTSYNTLSHGKAEIMWPKRELFKLGQYKSQCVLALNIHYFPFGYFWCTKSFRSAFRLPRAHHYLALQFVETNIGQVPCEAYSLHRGSKQTKHQGKELAEGSSSHILSPSVIVPHRLVLLYSEPVITLSKCLMDFVGTRWKHSNGHWADMFWR